MRGRVEVSGRVHQQSHRFADSLQGGFLIIFAVSAIKTPTLEVVSCCVAPVSHGLKTTRTRAIVRLHSCLPRVLCFTSGTCICWPGRESRMTSARLGMAPDCVVDVMVRQMFAAFVARPAAEGLLHVFFPPVVRFMTKIIAGYRTTP